MQNDDIVKAVIRSQHCQRNWDLTKTIPDEDLKLLEVAVTQCPSKQNFAFYKVNFITNRSIIEWIHENTVGFGFKVDKNLPWSDDNTDYTTNSQTLANLLIVIEYVKPSDDQTERNDAFNNSWKRDADMAIGIAAGYLNVIASIKNYRTGCCACFDNNAIKEILNTSNDIALMMGIGFKDDARPRREHMEDPDIVFPTLTKEPIEVKHIS